ncbi:hypothetical protein Tco_0319398 [Tanacetum coccineum]
MANENVPAPAPTRSNDQILPFVAWVPIRKSNFVLDLQKKQRNPIFQIFLDESCFILDANLLRESLEITPIDQAHQFMSPSLGDAIMDFVNELGYTEEIHFVSRMANLNIATQKGKKTKPHVILYCQFTKLIICYLGRTHNIYQRSASPFHLTKEDHRHENLKFVPKGEVDEVFGMQIPKKLITDNIRNAPYYNAYLEMVSKHDRKIAAEEGGKKKSAAKVDQSKKPATFKKLKPVPSKQSKQAPAKQPKPMQEKSTKPSPIKKAAKALEPQEEDEEFDLQRGITQKLPIVEGKGKWIATDKQVTQSLVELQMHKKTKIGAETDKTSSEGDTEILNIDEEQGENVANKSRPPSERVLLEEDQAGPNPGQSHMAVVGSDPEPMHDDFIATVYPQVHESLKHPYEEHVHVENPLSSTGTLSSMKNLEAFTLGDQFLNDKTTEEDSRKTNMETKVESMVTVLIHQASSSVPPLYTPIIDLTPPKPVDEFFEATTKSRKSHHDDQDPPPPPPDSDQKAPSNSSKQKSVPQSEQPIKDVPIPDDVNISDSKDTSTAHLPSIKTKADWFKPADSLAKSYKDPKENKRLSKIGDMGSCIKWYCKWIRKKKLTKDDLEGVAYMTVEPFHTNNISLQFQMEEYHWLLTDKIDLMNPKGHWVMPDILSVTCLKTYERYGYTYLREIVLRRADYNEYKISKVDFKNLHPNDFEDLYLLHPQGKLNHLPGSDKVHLFNATRAIIYRDRSDQKKMMRLNEVHKFSDGTLTRILEKLDHMVKDFKLFK